MKAPIVCCKQNHTAASGGLHVSYLLAPPTLSSQEALWQLAASFCQAHQAQLEVPWSRIGEARETEPGSVPHFCMSWGDKQRLAEEKLQRSEDVNFLRALIKPQLKALGILHAILRPLATVMTDSRSKREQKKAGQVFLSRELWTEFCLLVDLPRKGERKPAEDEEDTAREIEMCEAEWGLSVALRQFRVRLGLLQEREEELKNLAHRVAGETTVRRTLADVTKWLDSVRKQSFSTQRSCFVCRHSRHNPGECHLDVVLQAISLCEVGASNCRAEPQQKTSTVEPSLVWSDSILSTSVLLSDLSFRRCCVSWDLCGVLSCLLGLRFFPGDARNDDAASAGQPSLTEQ